MRCAGQCGHRDATDLEQLDEALVLAAHVLDRIEDVDAGREAALDLGDRLGDVGARLGRLEVLGQEDAQMRDAVDGREQDGHDDVLARLVGPTRPQTIRERRDVVALLRRAVEQHVDDVLLLRDLVAQRPALPSQRSRTSETDLGPGPLAEVDADAPAKVDVVGLDAEEATGLEERQRVGRVVDAVARVLGKGVELLAQVEVLGDLRLLLDVHRRVLRRQLLQLCARQIGPKGPRGPCSSLGTDEAFWNWKKQLSRQSGLQLPTHRSSMKSGETPSTRIRLRIML